MKLGNKNCLYHLPFLDYYKTKYTGTCKGTCNWEAFIKEYTNISQELEVASIIICYLVFTGKHIRDIKEVINQNMECDVFKKIKLEYVEYCDLIREHQKL